MDCVLAVSSTEVFRAEEADTVRVILGVIANRKGPRTHARFLVKYAEDELREIDSRGYESIILQIVL